VHISKSPIKINNKPIPWNTKFVNYISSYYMLSDKTNTHSYEHVVVYVVVNSQLQGYEISTDQEGQMIPVFSF
jgi:hypothetical protein